MNMLLNDNDIDALIASVSKELTNQQTLIKSESLKKDDAPKPDPEPEQEDPSMPPGAPAPDAAAAPAPEAEAPSEMAPDMAPAGEMPPAAEQADQAAPGEAPPEAPEQPGQEPDAGQDMQMSDEDLMQIYAGMDDQELERHALIAQEELSRRHGQETEPPAQHQADMPLAASEKGTENLRKSETDAELETLKQETKDLKKSVELLTQAIEAGFKPVRKSVQGIEFIQRGEDLGAPKPLSDRELKSKLKDITRTNSLTKAERTAIDQYCLYGSGRDVVEKLVIGGK